MQPDKRNLFRSPPIAGDATADYRRRLEEVQAEVAERRQQQIEEQCSPHNSPSVRIRAWERLHQVDLPRDPAHHLVEVIAANTGLSAAEVRAEQVLRAGVTG